METDLDRLHVQLSLLSYRVLLATNEDSSHGLKKVDGLEEGDQRAAVLAVILWTELDAVDLDGVGLGQRLQRTHQIKAVVHDCHLLLMCMVDSFHFPSQ
jgi:hypothetical protein